MKRIKKKLEKKQIKECGVKIVINNIQKIINHIIWKHYIVIVIFGEFKPYYALIKILNCYNSQNHYYPWWYLHYYNLRRFIREVKEDLNCRNSCNRYRYRYYHYYHQDVDVNYVNNIFLPYILRFPQFVLQSL
jgi:hypothetical protein